MKKDKTLHILGIIACLVMVILLLILMIMQWQEESLIEQFSGLRIG